MFNDLAWGQFALLAWAAACLFEHGARAKSIPLNTKTWFEIAGAVLIVVLLFALLTEGRGCSRPSAPLDDALLCIGGDPC